MGLSAKAHLDDASWQDLGRQKIDSEVANQFIDHYSEADEIELEYSEYVEARESFFADSYGVDEQEFPTFYSLADDYFELLTMEIRTGLGSLEDNSYLRSSVAGEIYRDILRAAEEAEDIQYFSKDDLGLTPSDLRKEKFLEDVTIEFKKQ